MHMRDLNAGGFPPPRNAPGYGAPGFGAPPPAPPDDKFSKVKDPVLVVLKWFKERLPRDKGILMGLAALMLLLVLWRTVEDHDTLFILAEVAHFAGIGLLIYKITSKRSVAGLSLRTQELTALFLAIRLLCSFMMEYDIHTILDALTLLASGYVVFVMRFGTVHTTYQKEQDTVHLLYVIVPCLGLAGFAHPKTSHHVIFRVMWGFCVYLEAVSVLPQLRMMQNAKVVERFTAHYVFALALSRFFSCAHWVLQVLDGNKYLLTALGSGVWPVMVLLSEIVQTFILADFCYYYLKSYSEGSGIVRIPAGIV